METSRQTLADRVTASAERTVEPLLARAKLFGLPSGASRALEYPCGTGARTAVIAHSLGEAVGIDPSAESIESAAIMHRSDPRCVFVTGGLDAVEALDGKFDFAYADLRRAGLTNTPRTVAGALLRALVPGGMIVISVRSPTRAGRLLATALPSRHPLTAVREAIVAAGGRMTWVGRGEDDSLLVYAVAAPRVLHLIKRSPEK